jgi:hypothetical protein
MPKPARQNVTPVRNLPAVQAGRSLAAMLNFPASQTMPAIYRQEIGLRLQQICDQESSFEGNQQALAYKLIAQIAGTSHKRQPGLSGTPTQVMRTWQLNYTHLFRQVDMPLCPSGTSEPQSV